MKTISTRCRNASFNGVPIDFWNCLAMLTVPMCAGKCIKATLIESTNVVIIQFHLSKAKNGHLERSQ